MLFQHYTVDDCMGVDAALNGRFNFENLEVVIQTIDPYLNLVAQEYPDGFWYRVDTSEPGKTQINGMPFDAIVMEENYSHPQDDIFLSPKSWIYYGGLPVIVDEKILREDYPQYNHLSVLDAALKIYNKEYIDNDSI